MNTFKIGDRVRRIKHDCDYKNGQETLVVGDVGTVTKVGSGGWIDVDHRNGSAGFNPKYFELVSPDVKISMLEVIDEHLSRMARGETVDAYILDHLSTDQLKSVRLFIESFTAT